MKKSAGTVLLLLPLTGCYNLLIVNVGIANKNAAALTAPLDPEVACAALASPKITIATTNPQSNVEQEWLRSCEKIIDAQQKKKKEKKR